MQQGIQSAHVIAEMCSLDGFQGKLAREWAINHKVIRVLNAGSGDKFNENMSKWQEIRAEFKQYNMPFAAFKEPDISNIVTAFGFILTADIVSSINATRSELMKLGLDPDDIGIIQFLSNMSPAK